MVHLRDMSADEYATFYEGIIEGYATEIARNAGQTIEEARTRSQQQIAELLAQGQATPGHRLWMVVRNDDDEAVGQLWCYSDTERRRAFIYDIDIFPDQQNKGYGSAALVCLEDAVRPEGITSIGLHVFGDNTRAQALYRKLGYQVTGFEMRKTLVDAL